MEVHKQGGGINFTVDHVHKASEDELYKNLCHNTKQMLNSGMPTDKYKNQGHNTKQMLNSGETVDNLKNKATTPNKC